jgi:hypothetical protein
MVEQLFHRGAYLSRLHADQVEQFIFNPYLKEALRRNGVSEAAFRRIGRIGSVSARYNGHRFEPDPNGIRSLTIAIPRTDGGVLDIVAFAPGYCGALDGVAWELGQTDALARTRLHATPFDWLRAGGDGLYIVNWQMAPEILRTLEITLLVENEQQRIEVERRLAPPPKIKVGIAPRAKISLSTGWGANP